MEKSYRPKLRRYSSADEHNSTQLTADDRLEKEKFLFKRESIGSDIDSGTEEIEQLQLEQVFTGTTTNDNEDQFSVQSFGPNPDEGFSECERETEESQLLKINKDRKLNRMSFFFLLCHHDAAKFRHFVRLIFFLGFF